MTRTSPDPAATMPISPALTIESHITMPNARVGAGFTLPTHSRTDDDASPNTLDASAHHGPARRLALATIRFYQRRISPGLAPACRFQPTCSDYAYEAIETHGTAKGALMAAWRILRCNPLNDGGLDPVPDRHSQEGPSRA